MSIIDTKSVSRPIICKESTFMNLYFSNTAVYFYFIVLKSVVWITCTEQLVSMTFFRHSFLLYLCPFVDLVLVPMGFLWQQDGTDSRVSES